MKAIIEMLGSMNFRGMRKRAIASALALLMIVSMVPAVWIAANAADSDYICGLEEHAHSAECYAVEASCGIPEGEQYGAHTHSEDCFAARLICKCEEEVEHTDECYAEVQICTLEEGENILLGEHTHTADCYSLICEKKEHIHTEKCAEASKDAAEDTANNTEETLNSDNLSMLRSEGNVNLSLDAIWDYGTDDENENIIFGSDEIATIEHNDILESETVSVRISAVFPDGAVDKKITITLKEGLVWYVNGEDHIPDTSLKSVSALQNQSVIYGKALENGSYTYEFVDGVENADIDIMVKKTILTNFREISDAIVVEASCINKGFPDSAIVSLKKLQPQQHEIIQAVNNHSSINAKPDETVFIVGSPFTLHNYTSSSAKHHQRLYDYAEFTLEAPSDIILVTAENLHSSSSVGNSAIGHWKLKSQETNGDITTYVFRTENFSSYAIGITPEWNIPHANYSAGDKVVIKVKKAEWKLYGDDKIYSRNSTGTHTYTVVEPDIRHEIVAATPYSHTLQYREDSPDAVYQLAGWILGNTGADPSVPKVVDFEFDTEKIGVTGVTMILPKAEKIYTVWYKLVGDTEWREASIEATTSSKFGASLVTNVALGLNENDYFSAFRYELDFIDDNGTPSDPSDDFRFGIPARTTSTGTNGLFIPIAGVNLGFTKNNESVKSYVRVYDKTAEGEPIYSDTGKVALTTKFSKTAYNYMYFTNVLKGESISASAGTTLHLSAKISATYTSRTSVAYGVGFTHYPIIYIRDETGEGISNVSLVNSNKVDILKKYSDCVHVTYSHTETEDFNGDGKLAKVYKIDTSPLSALSLKKDRYAAAVGFFDASGKKNELTLSYTITPPSTYNDSQTLHYMSDAIMLSDASITSSSNRNTDVTFSDPYDVNNDGNTSGISILSPNEAIIKNYYVILSRADISVSASTKKTSDTEYVKWDGSENYFQAEPDSEINVNFSVFNGSGNPTSTDPDKTTYIYIPIPVKGDEWGALNRGIDKNGNETSEFMYTAELTEAIPNPDSNVFEITYANIDTSVFSASTDISVIGTTIRKSTVSWGEYSPNANCIRIALRGMPSSVVPEDFVQTFAVNSDESAKGETNIYSALYFEDITDDQGRRYTGWFKSDSVAIQITWGEISGRVWIDSNGNGLQDEGEKGLSNTEVALIGNNNYLSKTNTNGEYSFSKISIGEYSVQFALNLNKYSLSAKNAGSSDKIDSDAILDGSTAMIAGVIIPYTDDMGKPAYNAKNLDIGLVPYVNIEYEWNGDIPSGAILPDNTKIAAGKRYTAEAVLAVEGYAFDGWYTDAAMSRKFVDNTLTVEDTTLYGKWTIKEYTITFDTKGGSAIAPVTQNYASDVTAPADPVREGYTFKGWDTEIPSKMPAKDLTVTAQWETNKYTITFDTKGGSVVAPVTQDYASDVTAPSDPVREGYTFKGWDTEIPSKMPAKDLTVTARWEINKYTIDFVFAGEIPDGAKLPAAENADYNTNYMAASPVGVRGWLFDGWYTDEACTTAYTDGTAVTNDVTLYGKWTRSTVDVEGSVNWVENGEGFTRPDTVTVKLMRDGTKIDSVEVTVDDKTSQSFTFADLPEYSEDGTVKYEYTVAQETVPTNYVETVSGYEVVNTYNVNKYYITVEWDHTGAPAAEKVTEATVILNRDGEGYKTATLTEATPTATTTIARPEAAGHTFSIEQNAIPGYETTYSEPVSVDTDNDGEVDAVTYTVRNTYIMPKTSVSGDIEWVDVPDGETVPDITVNLMLNGKVVDTVEIPAGNPTYQFTNLDRYNADGTPAEYTVEVEAIPSYSTAYSDAETDEDGNRTINITNTGEFEYGSLTVKNTVVGGDDEFTFTVTVGKKAETPQTVTYAIRRAAAVQYPYSGTYSGTITAGEPAEFTLKNGEYITIENMLVGVNYTVVQKAHPDYYTTPASLTASGVISADETVETFVNSRIPTGTLSITTKVTGSGADKNTIFEYKVTIDSEDSFEYTIGETTGTIKSGDVLRLKHGETAVIVGIKEETSYTVTQVADQGYKMTSTGTSGKVTAQGITASFINTKEASGGSNVPDTGDYSSGTGEIIAIYVMQTAMLMMLFCAWRMKRRKENEEA